jgi:hypothetical protein
MSPHFRADHSVVDVYARVWFGLVFAVKATMNEPKVFNLLAPVFLGGVIDGLVLSPIG